ncbi:MAG: hypothetical protein WBI29_01635 [Candidatus Saccharimonadales bacterium]
MNENKTEDLPKEEELSFRDRHSFLIFISISIFLSITLVSISLAMYNSSGAAQLDLSRPGYVNVRSQAISNGNSLKSFSSSGNLSQEDIDYFQEVYAIQAEKVTSVQAFGGDPLEPISLGIEEAKD